MLTKEVKEQIKDMTKDQLLEGVRKGTLNIPQADRVEFFQFAAKTPEERAAEIQGGTATIPVAPAGNEPDKGTQGGDAAQIPAQVAGGAPSTDPWAELGYKSPTEIVEAHKSLLKQVASLSATIDGLNAKGGKTGQELKRLKEEREELMKKINASEPSLESQKPQKPARPRPDQFEDGILDENYQKKLLEYEDAFEAYTEKLVEFNSRKNKEEVTAVVETKFKEAAPVVVDDDGFNELFNNAIPKFQEKFNLKMVNSAKEISDAYIALSSTDPVRVARANEFLAKVPPADKQKYELIKEAVDLAYDFSTGKAVPRYKTIEGALFDAGKLGDNSPYKPVIIPAALTPEEELAAIQRKNAQNNSGVAAIPASQSVVGDPPPSSALSNEEKKLRYKSLMTDYNIALASRGEAQATFEKSEKFQELLRLRKELFNSTPHWR